MKSIKFLAVAICTLLAGAAFAQDTSTPDSSGPSMGSMPTKGNVEVALRLGYGLGMGNAVQDSALSDTFSGFAPAQLDVGYRFNQNWFAGAYFSYGLVFLNGTFKDQNCQGSVSCSASDMRFGVEGQYHIMLDMSFDPWVGLGVGYEIAHTSVGNGSFNDSGLEFANLQVGTNWKVANNFQVGPFINFSFGEYMNASIDDGSGNSASGSIDNKSMHMLLNFGVRGVFDMQM